MQAPRQRNIAELIRAQLAQNEPGMPHWVLPGEGA